MRWKQVEDEPKTFALIFETGDEIATVLQQFARGQRLGGNSFKATSRFARSVSLENTSSSTARARINAPTGVESMRIELPRAERFDRRKS